MRKTIFIVSLILILSIYFASSITTFIYNETELVSLKPQATDPDNQRLSYAYSKPLNNKGDWQTDYGDAGEYNIKITVSDGELSSSEEVLVVVKKKEMAPVIDSFKPNVKTIEVNEGKELRFKIKANDLNKDELSYAWFLDGEKIVDGNEFVFSPKYGESGEHKVKVVVNDGKNDASNEWNVVVNKVDLKGILEGIKDVEISETGVARLDLPNFKKYDLEYEISEPLGEDNYWKTDHDSEGEYEVTVKVEGKGFSGSKDVKVTVLNKDRPVKFEIKGLYFVRENEGLKIELKADDPDGDEIEFSVEGLPEGSSFEKGVFEWKPGYDTIKKDNLVDYALDKFHLLTKSFKVAFIAKTKYGEVKKAVSIVVQDNNRPFIIEEFDIIEVNEGDMVRIEPKYNDPDNDKVRFSYSGWINKDTRKTNYGYAGEYHVKVTGTDGYYSAYRFVKIIVKKSNRKPVFSRIGDFEIGENESLEIELKANDPDKDDIEFSSDNLPSGSELEDGLFSWRPDFDFVGKNESEKDVIVNFIASDGKDEDTENSTITVYDKNRAPEIIEVSKEVVAKVGEPITFWVNAEDNDGDELTYKWAFSRFEEYEATAAHERTFTKKGNKKIKVVVSDGFEEGEHEWEIIVT